MTKIQRTSQRTGRWRDVASIFVMLMIIAQLAIVAKGPAKPVVPRNGLTTAMVAECVARHDPAPQGMVALPR